MADNDDERDDDDDVPMASKLLGMSGDACIRHEKQRAVTQTLVHELDKYAMAIVSIDVEGATCTSCISADVPDELDATVVSRLADAMRRCADEIEAWTALPREDKH